MGAFAVYTLKVAVCLLLLFMFNKLVFSGDTFHKFNRWAWLAIVPVSLLLPLADFKFWDILFPTQANAADAEVLAGEVGMNGVTGAAGGNGPLAIAVIAVFAVWATGALSVLIALAVSYIKMIGTLHRRCDAEPYNDLLKRCCAMVGYSGKVRLSVSGAEVSPFSWMHYIVVSKKDLDEDGKAILLHELSHVKSGHSWDILLMNLFAVFQWFNPAVWLTKHSLQQVHEYSADEAVIESGIDAKQYQLLLIKKAVGQRLYSMANSFNHSKLKNRITMMLKKKSSVWGYFKCLYAIPIAFIAVSAFASPKVSAKLNELSGVKFTQKPEITENTVSPATAEDTSKTASENVNYSSIAQMPMFMGGDAGSFSQWVAEHMAYPKDALDAKVAGTVYVQFTIAADGSVSDVKPVMTKLSSGSELNEYLIEYAAATAVKSSPKWTPGKDEKGENISVSFTFPVVFSLPAEKGE